MPPPLTENIRAMGTSAEIVAATQTIKTDGGGKPHPTIVILYIQPILALYKLCNKKIWEELHMSVLTDLIYGGSNAVAGLTEGAVNDAIAKYGAEKEIAFPDTAY